MEKVQFETNVPQTLALKFAGGKSVISQLDGNEQILFTTVTGKPMYLYPSVAQKILELKLKPGEPFTMVKREVRNGDGRPRIEWQVQRQEENGRQTIPASTAPVAAQNVPNGSTSQQNTPPTKLAFDRALPLFLVVAGRSVREAETQLAAEGGSVRFDNRDIAALATTMFIQSAREGWLTWMTEEARPAPAPTPREQQQTIAAEKIEELERKAATSETEVTSQLGTKRGEMKQAFAALREQIGETRWLQELKLAGVRDPLDLRYIDRIRDMYKRLLAIAREEVA
jgi:hypothetical protein